jgi:activating signal cointegrator 1
MMHIKAITLWQPWATLMAIGAKRFETRSWATSYKGPIAIHAAKRPINRMEINDRMRLVLRERGPKPADIPLGQVVAIGYLRKIYPTSHQGTVMAGTIAVHLPPLPNSQEASFGDWSHGRFAWLITDIWSLVEPVPARGRQQLWSWQLPDDLVEEYAAWRQRVMP